MLRPGSLINARLILAIGSRSGLEAPLHPGYYMIGRHKECQIRPKSRSVSRRHCLVHYHENGLRVLDLNSASGTYVDDKRLDPKTWHPLDHGATLRCGKVLFKASVDERKDPIPTGDEPPDPVASSAGSMVTGQAWQDVDIAGFLESEDDAEREERYSNIRAQSESITDLDAGTDGDEDTDIDLDLFDESFGDAANSASPTSDENQSTSAAAAETKAISGRETTAMSPTSSTREEKQKQKKKKPVRPTPMPKKIRKQRGSGFSLSFSGGADTLKLIGAIVLAIAVFAFFSYMLYEFYTGPPVRVIKDID